MLITYIILACAYVIIGEAIGFWHYTATEPKAGIVSFTYGSLWLLLLILAIVLNAVAYLLLYLNCSMDIVVDIARKAFVRNTKRMPSLEDTLANAVKNLVDVTTQLFPPKK
jgi:hypothetical protein